MLLNDPLRSRFPQDHPSSTTNHSSPRSPYISKRPSLNPSLSPTIDDVLAPGDIVALGSLLQGEILRLVSIGKSAHSDLPEHEKPANQFQVVRRLGSGSYAVVYLVQEVLYRPPPSTAPDHDKGSYRPGTVYGRQYAIKCLSKANLDDEALAAQMSEVTIHQSLPSHPNIVTLHRTLETSAFLLLLLEYVPGEDLFYFLEQSRDHYHAHSDSPHFASSPSHSSNESSTPSTASARTPPTPSLLSSIQPSQQLSRTRLRLIASMFVQMCDAVAACHAQQVFHRDIKPENFIVTDGWSEPTNLKQDPQRKVIVKLTDFGLSTTEVESSDMDCGSAPYMSYECRNNIAPTYRPRAADVWSLGIVLINMIYHINPWTDTAQNSCSSFVLFRQSPVMFFMNRFAGMTRPVAELLATRVFNTLDPDDPDDTKRMGAKEFGIWAKDLPDLFCEPKEPSGHKRVTSISSIQGFPLSSSTPVSHRPTSRAASRSTSAVRTLPNGVSQPRSRASSLAYDRGERIDPCELSTVIDQDVEEGDEAEAEAEDMLEMEEHAMDADRYQDADVQVDEEDLDHAGVIMMTSRSTSTNKRRKRGARKGKAAAAAAAGGPSPTPLTLQTTNLPALTPNTSNYPSLTPITPSEKTSLTLAVASLARELSQASKAPSQRSHTSVDSGGTTMSGRSRNKIPYEPVSMYSVPMALCSGKAVLPSSAASIRSTGSSAKSLPSSRSIPPVPPLPISTNIASVPAPPAVPTTPTAAKKSKWKLSFGKTSAATLSSASMANGDESASPQSSVDLGTVSPGSQPLMSSTASNVTNLLMGLNAPHSAPPLTSNHNHVSVGASPSLVSMDDYNSQSTSWSRGRRGRALAPPVPPLPGSVQPAQILQTQLSHAFQQNPSRSRGRTQHVSAHGNVNGSSASPHPSIERWSHAHSANNERQLDRSPNRLPRSAGHLPLSNGASNGFIASSSSSVISNGSSLSNNWRHSTSTTSSAVTSTSAFTSFSNSSARSVSTTATSVSSAGSWRTGNGAAKSNGSFHNHSPPQKSPTSPVYPGVPRNIKIMDGVPWELNQLPRGQHPNPDFGQPPVRKARAARKPPKDVTLDTISERPSSASPPISYQGQKTADLLPRRDAMTSTTDLGDDDGDGTKKVVQKAQITSLAKMLSAWKR